MTKKRFASSAHVRQRAKNARHMPDSMLDLTDIPEARDAQLRRARRVGRPSTGNAKQLIAIRVSPKVLARLRRLAAQTLPNLHPRTPRTSRRQEGRLNAAKTRRETRPIEAFVSGYENAGSISLGPGAAICAARSRCHLRKRL